MMGEWCMADIKNGSVTITGLSEFEKKLEQLKTDNPGFEKRLRGVIRKVLSEVRKSMQRSAKVGLNMNADPRKAYKAVRMAVYRRILGGQVNILQSYNAMPGVYYEPPRKLRQGQRGGNRMRQSSRTHDIMSYQGADRGFILRFLNAGTEPRYAGHGRNGRSKSQRNRHIMNTGGQGHRGAISARNWFGPRSQEELEHAARNIQALIDDIVAGVFY
jgi:hypothetical protein